MQPRARRRGRKRWPHPGRGTLRTAKHVPRELAGRLGVAYVDVTAAALRFARRVGGTWTDEAVYTNELGDSLPDGKLAVSFADDNADSLWYAEGF
jgi:hypothetical protein